MIPTRRPRVLLVEDHRGMMQMLARLFHHSGWDVVECRSVHEGYAALATHMGQYAAAVVDLMLPDGPPADLIRDIRALRAAARVVVCTACVPGNRLVQDAVAAGADAVYFKPIDFARLLAVIAGTHPGDAIQRGLPS